MLVSFVTLAFCMSVTKNVSTKESTLKVKGVLKVAVEQLSGPEEVPGFLFIPANMPQLFSRFYIVDPQNGLSVDLETASGEDLSWKEARELLMEGDGSARIGVEGSLVVDNLGNGDLFPLDTAEEWEKGDPITPAAFRYDSWMFSLIVTRLIFHVQKDDKGDMGLVTTDNELLEIRNMGFFVRDFGAPDDLPRLRAVEFPVRMFGGMEIDPSVAMIRWGEDESTEYSLLDAKRTLSKRSCRKGLWVRASGKMDLFTFERQDEPREVKVDDFLCKRIAHRTQLLKATELTFGIKPIIGE